MLTERFRSSHRHQHQAGSLPEQSQRPVIEYGSIRSNSSNRSKCLEQLKWLERFEPRLLAVSALGCHTAFTLADLLKRLRGNFE